MPSRRFQGATIRLIVIWVLFGCYVAVIFYFVSRYSSGDRDSDPKPVAEIVDTTGATSELDSLLGLVYTALENEDLETARRIARQIMEDYPDSYHAQLAAELMASLNDPESSPLVIDGHSLFPVEETVPPETTTPPPSQKEVTRKKEPRRPTGPDPGIARRQQELRESEMRVRSALSRMNGKRETGQGITWYHNENVSHFVYKNSIEAYIGQSDDGDVWMRIRFYYSGERHLNITAYELYADDREYNLATLYGNLEQGRGSGGAWEWFDMHAGRKEFEIVETLSTAKRASLRYIGENGVFERTLTEGEKIRLGHVLEAYRAVSQYAGRRLGYLSRK